MEAYAYLCEMVAGVIYLLAGARLVNLGMRTGQAPERLLGASFAMFGMSGLLYGVGVIEIFRADQTPIYFAARVVYLPGSMLIAVFTMRVFRADARWARWLVIGVALLFVAAIGGSAVQGEWEGFSLGNI